VDSIARMARTASLVALLGCGAAVAHASPADQARAPAPAAPTGEALDALPMAVFPGVPNDRFAVTRWSRAGVGVSLGAQATWFAQVPDRAGAAPVSWIPRLGLHWSGSLSGRWQVGVSGWADLPSMGAAAPEAGQGAGRGLGTYTAQVQVQWQSARYGGLVPEYGAIGVQMQGGSRLLLRARHGGPMIYYRVRF